MLTDYMPQKVTFIVVYCADLLCKKHVAVKEKRRGMMTNVSSLLQLLTGHMLNKLLYLNADLKKCIIHHILKNRHQVPVSKVKEKISLSRNFQPTMSSSM